MGLPPKEQPLADARHRAARREEVRVLARACLISGVVVGITVLVPFSPTAPRGLGAALTVVAFGLGTALSRWESRVLSWHLHVVLGVASVAVAGSVAASTTPNGTLVTSVAYLWIATFSAVFHRGRVLLRHLAGMAAGLGAGLWVAGVPSAPQAWFFLVATFGCVAWVLNGRVVELRLEATTDPLTGVLTRRAFERAADLEMTRAARTGQPLTLAVLDLDDFKAINDQDGHAAGDAVLVGLTSAWRAALRPEDVIGRFGGDEFLLLLPRTDTAGATVVLSRLSSDLCGWSVGVALWEGQELDDWFAAADHDLYAAKPGH
jgi:GGDEF domain-containing protein